jgi:hypothetical protein
LADLGGGLCCTTVGLKNSLVSFEIFDFSLVSRVERTTLLEMASFEILDLLLVRRVERTLLERASNKKKRIMKNQKKTKVPQ